MERQASDAKRLGAASKTGAAAEHPRSSLAPDSESRWPIPAALPKLAGDRIHVWCAGPDELVSDQPCFAETLSAGERNRAERFQFDRDRDRFIARHGLLRRILGHYLSLDPAGISFIYESRGKPALPVAVGGQTLHFSLSHSDGLVLVAVSGRCALGVDVERVRPIPESDQIVAKWFSARENAMLSALSAEQKLEAFFNGWTRKEAYLKATGEGIADALPEIEVSLLPGGPARLERIAGDERAAALWSLHSLAPAAGYIGALAVRAGDLKLNCWRWPKKFQNAGFMR